jgi:hypothetical protein
MEKYARIQSNSIARDFLLIDLTRDAVIYCRLRRADVEAEHTERQSKRHEQERDQWERKCEVRFLTVLSCPARVDR